MRVCEGILKQI